jgi:uncharacterized membrane protein
LLLFFAGDGFVLFFAALFAGLFTTLFDFFAFLGARDTGTKGPLL